MIDKNLVINWIRSYFEKNGNENTKAIIGISGGKDSTIAAALCVEALGKDRVVGVLMPQGEQDDIADAYRVIRHLGIEYHEINIDTACFNIYKNMINSGIDIHFVNTPVVQTNLPARIRMTTLYGVAAALGGRVCNTSNYSEVYVGYSTKWGDGVGDFAPLRNFFVSEVIDLGRQLNLPEDLIIKTPSDGMSGKTDEENMGITYEEIEVFVKGGTVAPEQVAKITDRHKAAAHKTINIPSCPRN